jgi:glycerophosphoryl diester phosphodiesterase
VSRDLGWLVARPIAHRGLHDAAAGIVENTRSAVRAAISRGYAVEVDLQLSADGCAVVFHDDELDRLTTTTGPVGGRSFAELAAIPLHGTEDRIWSLGELLAEIGGRVPLIAELKSGQDGDTRLARIAGEQLAAYSGPVAAKSFDPRLVEELREHSPEVVRGVVGCSFEQEEWPTLSAWQRFGLRNLTHWHSTRPDFLSWDLQDLPRASVSTARALGHCPVMTWTIRTPAEHAQALRFAEQIVFEGFLPDF